MKTLLALDGSPISTAAIDQMLAMPGPDGAEVVLLHVLEPLPPLATGAADWPTLQAAVATAGERAHDMLEAAALRLQASGFSTEIRVRDGSIAHVILKEAKDLDVDQIVVGSHGRGTIGRFVLGSVSDRVLHHAEGSVLIARPRAGGGKPDLRVLVGYDGSEHSRAAIESIADASWRGTAHVTILSIQQLTGLFRVDLLEADCRRIQAEHDQLETTLAQLVDRLQPEVASVDTLMLASSRPHEAILRTAAESDTDLIVVGHAGRTAIGQFLLGSVASKVAHQAPCSVLVVRQR